MKRLAVFLGALFLAAASLAAKADTIEPVPGTTIQFTTPGAFVPEPIGVLVRDPSGFPVEGAAVTFTVVAIPPDTGNGFFPGSGGTVVVSTDEFGFAIPEPTVVGIAEGSLTVEATTPSAPGQSVRFLIAIEGGGLEAADARLLSGRHLVTPVGATNLEPIALQVLDATGQPVPFAAVQFSAPAVGPSGTFEGESSVIVTADQAGVATAPLFVANGVTGHAAISIEVLGTSPVLGSDVRFVNTPAPSQQRCRPGATRGCRL